MTRKKLFRLVFVAGAVLLAVSLVVRSEWAGQKVCEQVRKRAPTALGLEVRIGHCQLEPWELQVDLRQVEVELKPGGPAAVSGTIEAERVNLKLEVWAGLLERRIARLEVIKPSVNLDLSHVLDESKPPKPGGTCRVNELVQEVPQANITVADGSAHLLLPGDRVLDLGTVDLTTHSVHRVATVHLTERGGQFTFRGGEIPLDQLTLSAALDSQNTSLEVSRLEFIGGQLSVLGKASARNLCDPDVQVEASTGIPMDLVSALINEPATFAARGYVTANVRASGKLDAQRIRAHADLDVNDLEILLMGQHLDPENFTASLDAHDGELVLHPFYWPLGEGYGKISGSMALRDDLPFNATVEGKNIPFGELLNHLPLKHPWVDSLASVKARQSGHILPSPFFSGPVSADFNDFHVRTRAWDAPAVPGDEVFGFAHEHVDANFEFDKALDRIHLTKVHLTGPTADLDAEGFLSLDTQKGLDLTADLKNLDLAEVGGAIAGLPWKGTLSAHAHITGAYGKQIIDAQVGIKDYTMVMVHLGDTHGELHFDPSMVLRFKDVVAVKNGRTSYGGSGQLDFSHGAPLGGGDVSINDGRVEDLLEVLKDVHWSFDMLDGQLTGRVSGSIHLKPGPILAPTSDFNLHLSQLSLYQRPMGSADFKMHTQDGDSITVPPFTVDGTVGTFTFGGWQRVGGELNYRLTMKDVSIPATAAPELTSWDLTGGLEGDLAITGPSQQPRIVGDVYGSELTLHGVPIGYGHVKVHGEGPSMAISGPVGNDLQLNLQMRWEGDLPMRARFAFATDDLFQYLPTQPDYLDVKGKLRGTLDVHGNMKDSSSYVGRLVFPTVEVGRGDYVFDNREPVQLAFHGDVFEIQKLAFEGRPEGERTADTRFSITGTRSGADDRLNLRLDGNVDARALVPFFPILESGSGNLAGGATVTGTQSEPIVAGSVLISNGRLKVRDQEIRADDVHGRVEFTRAGIDFRDGIEGTINRGHARLDGEITLDPKHLSVGTYNLQLALDDSQFHISDWPLVTVKGVLDWEGPAADPSVEGNLDVRRFRYSENLNLESVLESMKAKKVDARVFTRTPHEYNFRNLTIDLGVNSGDSVRIETNYLNAGLKGHLAVLGDNSRMLLSGQIEATSGATATWQSNRYQVDDMAVTFQSQEGIVPRLDAHLSSQVRDYAVFVHVFGTPDNYRVTADSKPGLNENDLFTLLNANFTSQDKGGTNEAQARLLGAGLNTAAGLAGLDTQFAKVLPKDGTLLSDPTIRLTTTYSLHYGTMEPTIQFDGKLLSKTLKDKLRGHYEQQPTTSSGTKAQIDYIFGEIPLLGTTSVKAAYDGDNSNYTTFPDVGGDLQFHTVIK